MAADSGPLARPHPAGWWRVALYVAAVLTPLTMSFLFRPHSTYPFVYEVGRSFALIGVMIFTLQVLLAGRVKWVERAFGFDMVIRHHRYMATFAGGLLVAHPLLLAVGGRGFGLFTSARVPWFVWAGRTTLAIVLANVLVSNFQTRLRFAFQRWRVFHDFMGLSLVFLAFTHSWFIGRDLTIPEMRWLWIALLIFEALFFVNHRFLRPRRLARDSYCVTDVKPEARGVWTLRLAPPSGAHFRFLPGQFHFLTLIRGRGLPKEEHHFTISSSPGETTVSSTIKELGDFTSSVRLTVPGDRAIVHAPFGRFSYVLHPEEKEFVFIAGGIGITPLMGMLRHMRDTAPSPVLLLYANESEEDIAFRDELDSLRTCGLPGLRVVHILRSPSASWRGEAGLLDRARLARFILPDMKDRGYYICGPAAMREQAIKDLKCFGIPDSRIHIEVFSTVWD